MILNTKSLEKLRLLINEESEYRSGPQLVIFFNSLGFNDNYGQGFPSRWLYTDDKLKIINGTPELDKCIKKVLNPSNFIDRTKDLDACILDFNKYLAFDKWKIIRKGADIQFEKLNRVEIDDPSLAAQDTTEDQFLSREFSNLSLHKLGLDGCFSLVLEERLKEIERCYSSGAYLAVVLIAGSTLEGILLGLASKYPRQFNVAKSAPKDNLGNVKKFHEWNLNKLIDASHDLQLIQYDTQKFSHTLRDFRNYIHPFQQMASGFSPRQHTAKICLQVLKAAIYEIRENMKKINI